MTSSSPYALEPKQDWENITEQLIESHPLSKEEITDAVFTAWQNIFETSIGKHELKIGTHLFPKPQIIGALLHELIPAELTAMAPDEWRPEDLAADKDIVNIQDDFYSIELKTSSNPTKIFGNRSYAQAPTNEKKGKDGYYLAVNFEKFDKNAPHPPEITMIRFGWLDHTDWRGQEASSGQQANLSPETYKTKFKTFFSKN